MSDKNPLDSLGLLPSIVSAVAQAPKEVTLRFLDVVSRGLGVAWEPANIALTAIAKRFADGQGLKAEAARLRQAAQLIGADRRLLEPLLNYEDMKALPVEERLAHVEKLLTSAPVRYLIDKENKKIDNRLSVINKAAAELPKSASVDQIPSEWIEDFFYYAERVSDEDMQYVWAKILVGKLERPGLHSKKTLRALQDIGLREAELFRKLCVITVSVDGQLMTIRLDRDTDSYLQFADLSFDDLLVLDDYGLVTLGHRGERVEAGSILEYGRMDRSPERFRFTNKVDFRANPLTRVGSDLYHITDFERSGPYRDAIVKMFGHHVETLVS